METVKKSFKKKPDQVFKDRVKAIKTILPKNWRQVVFFHFPKYDTGEGYNYLSNVHKGHTADVDLTKILEDIASGKLTLPV